MEPCSPRRARVSKLVSIPERVWGWLELLEFADADRSLKVSIPERVWGWLEPAEDCLEKLPDSSFNP